MDIQLNSKVMYECESSGYMVGVLLFLMPVKSLTTSNLRGTSVIFIRLHAKGQSDLILFQRFLLVGYLVYWNNKSIRRQFPM